MTQRLVFFPSSLFPLVKVDMIFGATSGDFRDNEAANPRGKHGSSGNGNVER